MYERPHIILRTTEEEFETACLEVIERSGTARTLGTVSADAEGNMLVMLSRDPRAHRFATGALVRLSLVRGTAEEVEKTINSMHAANPYWKPLHFYTQPAAPEPKKRGKKAVDCGPAVVVIMGQHQP